MYMPDRLEFIKTMIKSTSTRCAFHTNMKTLASDDAFEEQKTRADGDNREARAGKHRFGSVRVILLQFQSSSVSVSREEQLLLTLPRIQVFQRHFIAELVLIQQIHHVGFVVSQCFDGVKDVHRVLVTQHLTHNTDGTERAAAPAAV